jgi:Na+/pantothenate symporter
MPLTTLFAVGFSFFVLLIGYPIIAIRFYSMRDNVTIRRAVGISFIFQMIIAVSVAFVGVSARVLYPNLETPDLSSPTIAMEVLPPILGGLLLAAILAAIQSTVSAVLLMLGSAVSHDIIKQVIGIELSERAQVNLTRAVVLVMGIIPIPFALNPLPLIQQIWINAAVLIGSAFAVPTLFGLIWKRATAVGAIVSMVGGIVTAAAWLLLGNPFGLNPVYVSVPVSLLGFFLGSLVTKPVSREALALFFRDEREHLTTEAPVPGYRQT